MNEPTEIQPNSKSMTKEDFDGCKLTFEHGDLMEAIGPSLNIVAMINVILQLINTVEHGFKEEGD